MKNLPIGRHDFRALREANLLYVDKTPVIYRLLGGGMRWFLSRPRRFGKSLLVTTLRELFLGNREAFKGLWIEDKIEWKAYPVVTLLFDKISSRETGMAELLSDQLQEVAEQHGFSLQSDGIKRRTSELIRKLAGDTGAVILIDEYDKPILDAVADDLPLAQKRREILKEFFETLKSEDRHIHFIFITGVSKFSRMSVFSGMNNLLDITLDEQFATICGYTQAELESHFAASFPAIAQRHQWTEKELLGQVKEWYNGYHWRGEAVYNPWSVLNMAHNGRISNYWFASGHPEFLLRALKKGLHFQLGRVQAPAVSLDSFELENMDYRSLLFQTGYLTIVEEDIHTRTFTLGYPNREVEESLLHLAGFLREKRAVNS
ncbi:MAG: AAA family ATPase [Phaeodactylibacter sp.]|nr:AAA family ATPase [Phaeodactylibacter sp.]